MKILVVCQHYHPEPFRLTDICEELVKRGHTVTVLTGVPNYPRGEIFPGYEKHQRREEKINGVDVIRCTTVPRKQSVFFRVFNYFSYPIFAGWKAVHMSDDYDMVFVYQLSPVLMALPGIFYAKKHRKKLVLYCLDLWPSSLSAGGIGINSPIYHCFHVISRLIYRHADCILYTSRQFGSYFSSQFSIQAEKMAYLPQYSEDLFQPAAHSFGDELHLMFAGNLGAAQSVETILSAAEELKEYKQIWWHIIGDGCRYDALKAMAQHLDHVIFYGRQPLERMPDFYTMADGMLVTLMRDSLISLTLPGKVQTCMAAGKPIIAAADGEISFVIRDADCGYCVPAEDSHALAQAVLAFLRDPQKQEYGLHARRYFDGHFDRKIFFDRLEDVLRAMTDSSS